MPFGLVLDGDRTRVAACWSVTLDPESTGRRRTFDVPLEGLIAFISTAFARGATHVILTDGKERVRVSRMDNRVG